MSPSTASAALHRESRLALWLLVGAWVVLTAPWLAGPYTIPYDAKAHFYPQIQFLANALHSGQSPLWTPHVFAGSPQVADPQSEIFSPALLLAALVPRPSFRLVDAYVFALLFAGAAAVFALARDRGWHPAAQVTAALTFAFGTSAAWRIQHIGQIQSLAMFAVTLWLLERALVRRGIGWGIGAGLAGALMVVEPDQVALLGGYVLMGFVIAHWLGADNKRHTMTRSAPALAAGTIAGAALAALPLLMTWLFASASNRPEIAYSDAAHGSLHPASLLTGLVSDLFGAHDPAVDYWGPYSERWLPEEWFLSQNMSEVYAGALPMLLILTVGVWRGLLWTRGIRYFTLAWLALILFALGRYTPVFPLAYKILPGVDVFRRPADATFLIGALTALLSGQLVDRWVTRRIPAARQGLRWRLAEFSIPVVMLACAIAIALQAGHWQLAWKPLAMAALWMSVAAGLLWLVARSRLSATATVVLIAGLVVADLGVNNGPNESTALPREQYGFLDPETRNATIDELKGKLDWQPGSPWRHRVELAGLGFEWPNAAMIHGFDHVLGYNPLRLRQVTDVIGADDTIAGWDQRRFTPLFPSYRSTLADMLGLRYIATPVPIEKIDRTLKAGDLPLVAVTKDALIYENETALPRAVFVADWQDASFAEILHSGRWPSFDPRRTVLLERAPTPVRARIASSDLGFAPASHAPPVTPADYEALDQDVPGSVNLPVYDNTRIEIEVEAERPGFVILFDVWHPWWRATVDGKPSEILLANVLFRAVAVSAGTHRVVMTFEPVAGALAEARRRLAPR